MDYIDLLPISGRYRGVTRYLTMPKLKLRQHRAFFADYDPYLNWLAGQDDAYRPEVADMLEKLRSWYKEEPCEIICFADVPGEFRLQEGFLGFDVLGDFRASPLAGEIPPPFCLQLNANGLFSTYGEAQDFCAFWQGLISSDNSPWEVDQNPRPFCVWRYQREESARYRLLLD